MLPREAARVYLFILGLFIPGSSLCHLGVCASVRELRHRWWTDAEGAVVPSAFQEMAPVAHTEEDSLAGRTPGAGDPVVQGVARVWGRGEASEGQAPPHNAVNMTLI